MDEEEKEKNQSVDEDISKETDEVEKIEEESSDLSEDETVSLLKKQNELLEAILNAVSSDKADKAEKSEELKTADEVATDEVSLEDEIAKYL